MNPSATNINNKREEPTLIVAILRSNTKCITTKSTLRAGQVQPSLATRLCNKHHNLCQVRFVVVLPIYIL